MTSRICSTALTLPLLAASLSANAQLLHLRADLPGSISVDAQNRVTEWRNSVGGGQAFTSATGSQPLFVSNAINGLPTIRFDGTNDVLRSIGFGTTASEMTFFIVATPLSNTGSYRSFLAANTSGNHDYATGFNIDQTNGGSSAFNLLNLEGAKGGGGGGVDIKTSSDPFGTFKVLSLTYGNNQPNQLYVNGIAEGNRQGNANAISLQEMRVGARFYGGSERGYLHGEISEVIVYDRLLTNTERQAVENLLLTKYLPVPAPSALLSGLLGTVPGVLLLLRRRKKR
jgi:hypothetical protein